MSKLSITLLWSNLCKEFKLSNGNVMAVQGKKRKSVLIIVQNLPVPFDRRVWQEATSLFKSGYNVAVICPQKKIYTKSFEILEGVEIYRYPLIYEANQVLIGYFIEFIYCWLATLCLAILAYIRRPFQVIQACNPPDTFFLLALLFKPLGVKFIFDHHDLSPEMYLAKGKSKKDILYKALIFLEKLTLKMADLVIEVNESHKKIAKERSVIDESKIVIVRSGPKSSWAAISSPDEKLKKGKKYLVVYLGEMCAQDGVDYLLHAIRHYQNSYSSDTIFTLIGGGPVQQEMKDMANELKLWEHVCFTGRISDQELWSYLSTADVCVDPDPYCEWSNMSTMNKIIEYMAFGKPMVAFDLKEHRHSALQAAFYVKPNDAIEFAEKIRSLLEDGEKRKEMSSFARKRFIEKLAWENSAERLISAYDNILGIQTTI